MWAFLDIWQDIMYNNLPYHYPWWMVVYNSSHQLRIRRPLPVCISTPAPLHTARRGLCWCAMRVQRPLVCYRSPWRHPPWLQCAWCTRHWHPGSRWWHVPSPRAHSPERTRRGRCGTGRAERYVVDNYHRVNIYVNNIYIFTQTVYKNIYSLKLYIKIYIHWNCIKARLNQINNT